MTSTPAKHRTLHWMAASLSCALLVGCGAANARAAAPQGAGRLAPLAWMQGAWEGTSPDGDIDEHWSKPAGQSMQGTGRVVNRGRTRFFEFMSIEDRDDGVVFRAWPAGLAPTEFKLVEASAHRAVFSNPGHDFPQTIAYSLDSDGMMHARAEGVVKGEKRVDQYWVKRVK